MVSDIVGQTVGRYEIKELIGEGAMAMVYRAYDPEISRSIAFKVLKKDFCVDGEYLTRFLTEAKAAGALSHPNIVTIFDVGQIQESPYIMMEMLEGQDLGDVLKSRKTMSVKETLIIGLQLAKALNYAHSAGIVHRDIKPDNIIVQPDGESIKVADFGIARMDEREESQKTQVGSVLGTPRYMSPEQALGNEADGRADLFAVGAIMYEMLTGEKAFNADNIGTLMTQITQKQPRPIQELCSDIPAGLRQIIQKLLQKKPEKRFQTGDQLAKALGKELGALREQEEEQNKHKYVPLKVRWALSMGAIVAVVLMISMSVVFNIQSRSMTKQAVDAGESFAKFIAIETAVPLLSEDWITLETFISDAASRDTFNYLVVSDRSGIVRGASDQALVGQRYETEHEQTLIAEKDGITTTSVELHDGEKIFHIQAPVLFQNTEVGQIIVGLSQASLDEVKRVTGWLMFALAFVTISSVVTMIFIFGGLIARPLKTLSKSLETFRTGNHDVRISQQRNDEIGEVFDSFNKMAVTVQSVIQGESTGEDDKLLEQSDIVLSNSQVISAEQASPLQEGLDDSMSDETVLHQSAITPPAAIQKESEVTDDAASQDDGVSGKVDKDKDETVESNDASDNSDNADETAAAEVQEEEAQDDLPPDETVLSASPLAGVTDSDATVISSSLALDAESEEKGSNESDADSDTDTDKSKQDA